MAFEIDDMVYIRTNAFPNSDAKEDIEARGRIGIVVDVQLTGNGEDEVELYYVKMIESEDIICPIESELEKFKDV